MTAANSLTVRRALEAAGVEFIDENGGGPESTSPVPLTDKANTALDRIEIPQDVVERISELLTPASSLVISDYGISHETRKDTDFIVVTQ